jgi:hypothetical protein
VRCPVEGSLDMLQLKGAHDPALAGELESLTRGAVEPFRSSRSMNRHRLVPGALRCGMTRRRVTRELFVRSNARSRLPQGLRDTTALVVLVPQTPECPPRHASHANDQCCHVSASSWTVLADIRSRRQSVTSVQRWTQRLTAGRGQLVGIATL